MASLALAFTALLGLASAAPTLHARAPAAYTAVTPAQWAALNTSVGGRLAKGYPMGRPCYLTATGGTNGVASSAKCKTTQDGWTNDLVIQDQFGGYMNANWGTCQATGDQCLLDYQAPQNPLAFTPPKTCAQGSVPYYYVDVAQYQDVQAAIAFAKSTKIPLVIKSSGHDYKGRSSAPGSLGLWMHHLQSKSINKAFVAAGCSGAGTTAITHGAGLPFGQLFQFAEDNSVTVVGGSSQTVVPGGGWISGAGHSAISNMLGLGVDRVLEMKVVTPDGQYVTASRCQNQDLFFALRGGGGGVFGVAMEITTTASPKLTLQVAYIKLAQLDPNGAKAFMKIIIENSLKWAQEGWGGYIEPGAITGFTSGFVLMTPKLTNAEAKASMAPITTYAASLGNIALNNEVTEVSSFKQAFDTYLLPNDEVVGISTALASRFVPKENFANAASQATLLDALFKSVNTAGTNVLPLKSPGLVYGGAPTQILVTAPTNYPGGYDGTHSATPAWYNTVWHVLAAPTFAYSATPAGIRAAWKQAHDAMDNIRAITPNAAYQNEADIAEPNTAETFWGTANYNRLLAYKKAQDPSNVLTCWGCIGWNPSDPRYACYPASPGANSS